MIFYNDGKGAGVCKHCGLAPLRVRWGNEIQKQLGVDCLKRASKIALVCSVLDDRHLQNRLNPAMRKGVNFLTLNGCRPCIMEYRQRVSVGVSENALDHLEFGTAEHGILR